MITKLILLFNSLITLIFGIAILNKGFIFTDYNRWLCGTALALFGLYGFIHEVRTAPKKKNVEVHKQ